jgi:hypothetical protein
MKTLNIDSPIGQRIAQVALFEHIQAMFDIYPAKMVEYRRGMFTFGGEDYVVGHLRSATQKVFKIYLHGTVMFVEKSSFRSDLCYAGWYANVSHMFKIGRNHEGLTSAAYRLAEEIESKAMAESLDSAEYAKYLAEATPKVIDWAFDKMLEILKLGTIKQD